MAKKSSAKKSPTKKVTSKKTSTPKVALKKNTEKPLLEIKGLEMIAKTENGEIIPIIKGVDLALQRGEVLGLIGESGAGKSTIALSTMGYARGGLEYSGGKILFKGKNVMNMSTADKRTIRGTEIAYVAQSAAASFNPSRRLYDQVCESAVLHGVMTKEEARANAVELFKKLQLPNPETIGNRYPHQVSGGQLQRVMAAMAMMCKPDLLILDEPTTALDVTTQIEVLAMVRELIKEYNTAAIYVTHDLSVVMQVTDKIAVLRYGEKVEENTPDNLLNKAKEDYTIELLNARSEKPKKTRKIDTKKPLVQIKNVTAGYSENIDILHNISVDVPAGTTISIVGESGSGKSTLARSFVGLLPPRKGKLIFDGEELPLHLKDRNKEQLRRVQMIYQMPDTAMNPRQKVGEVIGRPLEFYFDMKGKEKENRILELLDDIDLPHDFANRYITELSGGQKQRVGIARALAAKPELIVCDEVTSALDLLVGEEILKLLQNLQDKHNYTYMFITHDLAAVKNISDYVVVMQHGKVVEQGTRDKVFNPPHKPYTDLLLSSVPQMRTDWLDEVLQHRLETTGSIFLSSDS